MAYPRILCLVAALTVTAGCAHMRKTPAPEPSVTIMAAEEGVSLEWKRIATKEDADRLARLDIAWGQGLADARAKRHNAAIASEGTLLEPAAALPRPAPPPGTYRCRVIKLGIGIFSRGRAFQAFKPFFCFVQAEGPLLTFVKGTGTQRPAGRLWDDGDTRLVFLGALPERPDASPPAYGEDPRRNQIGIIERVGDFRWRMVLPWQTKDAKIDVIELVPDTPAPTLAAQ